LADVDLDGDLDAIAGEVPAASIYRNKGTGILSQHGGFAAKDGNYVVSPAIGDLNGDGYPDVFGGGCCGGVAIYDDGRRVVDPPSDSLWFGDGQGEFTHSDQPFDLFGTKSIALGDLDGDGDLDAFVANGSEGSEPNAVWLNEGNGRFNHTGQLLGKNDSWAVALGDLDGDSDLDAFVGNGISIGGQANTIWLNDGSGHFSDSGLRLGNAGTRHIILVDLDSDGDLDAFAGNDGANKIWLNQTGR
jgi:hypothetical protein